MKIVETRAFKIHTGRGNWDNYIADTIEEAIKLCREEYPDSTIFSVEYMGTCKRKTTKTITVDV